MSSSLSEFARRTEAEKDVGASADADAIVIARKDDDSAIRTVLEALPAAVYMTDAAGRITYYNQAAVELAGREPKLGTDEWCVTWRLYTTDGTPLPH
jgi:PAS domain-containing protein